MERKIWNGNFIMIFMASILLYTGNQIIMVILPLFLEDIGCAPSVLGTATALASLAAMAARPVSGRMADRKSKRLVLCLGLVVLALGMLGFAVFPFALTIIAIRFLQGAGISAATTAQVAIAADTLPTEKVEAGLSYFGIGNTAAVILGPSLGLALVFGKDYAPAWLAGAGIFLAAMALVLAMPREKSGIGPGEGEEGKGFWAFFEKSAARPSLIWMILMIADAGAITFLPTYAVQMGVEDIGLFYTLQACTMFAATFLVGNLIHRVRSPYALLVPAILFHGSFPLLLFLANGRGMLLLAGITYGIGLGSTMAIVRALSLSGAALDRRGAASATFQCAQDLGYFTGSLAGGVLAGAYGYRTLNGLLLVCPAAAVLISLAALVKKDG